MKKIIFVIVLLLISFYADARMCGVMLSGAGTATSGGSSCSTENDTTLTSQTSSDQVSAAIDATNWRGNGFAVTSAFKLTAITAKIDKGSSTSSCTYTMRVYPHDNIYDTGLVPYTGGGALATSEGILGSNMPESGDIDFVFTTPVSLSAGAYFWAIGASGTGCDASLNYNSTITYDYGIAADSHAGANTWVADPASVDYFIVKGCAGASGTVWYYSGNASNPPSTNATGSNTQGEMAMMLLPGEIPITKASFNIHTVGSATACKWAIVNNAGTTQASGTFTPSTGWNDVSFTAFDSTLNERIYVAIQCNSNDYKYGTDSTVSSYYCSPDYADFTGAACYSNVVDDGLGISVRLGF
jgi:hypothetical protein